MREILPDTATSDLNESALWQAFKAGDRKAFARMLDSYYPSLLMYGYKLFPEKEFVKDAVHDLFLEIWNKRGKLADVQSIKAYLFQSLRNNILRESKKSEWLISSDTIAEQDVFDPGFHIEASIIANERDYLNQKKLELSISRLTKRQQEIIYLRFTQELTFEQIAETMNINYRSAVNLVHEAIKSIRRGWITLLIWAFSVFA